MSLLHAKCFECPEDKRNINPECHWTFSLLSWTWAKWGEHNHGASCFNGCRKCGSWDTTGFHSASVLTDEQDVSDVWAINCLFCDEAQLSLLGAGTFVFCETKLGLFDSLLKIYFDISISIANNGWALQVYEENITKCIHQKLLPRVGVGPL